MSGKVAHKIVALNLNHPRYDCCVETKGQQRSPEPGKKNARLEIDVSWGKIKREGNLAEFFANSPLRNSGLRLKRISMRLRKVEF